MLVFYPFYSMIGKKNGSVMETNNYMVNQELSDDWYACDLKNEFIQTVGWNIYIKKNYSYWAGLKSLN